MLLKIESHSILAVCRCLPRMTLPKEPLSLHTDKAIPFSNPTAATHRVDAAAATTTKFARLKFRSGGWRRQGQQHDGVGVNCVSIFPRAEDVERRIRCGPENEKESSLRLYTASYELIILGFFRNFIPFSPQIRSLCEGERPKRGGLLPPRSLLIQ